MQNKLNAVFSKENYKTIEYSKCILLILKIFKIIIEMNGFWLGDT